VTRQPVRILLVDDHTLFRESVARLLAAEQDFVIAGACANVSDALRLVGGREVDVLLLDFDLGDENGAALLRGLRAQGFAGRVLVVTAGVTPQQASELLRCDVAGIFLKHDPPASLCRCIREVAAGRACFDQELLARAVRTIADEAGRAPAARLTPRERQVLSSVLDGLANKQIAERLDVSESAVKGTLQQLFDKAGVRTRSQLVRVALERYSEEIQGEG
jgi:two-component system nitrate/nitrite response regulator NarL